MRKRTPSEVESTAPIEDLAADLCNQIDLITFSDKPSLIEDIQSRLAQHGLSALSDEDKEELDALAAEEAISSKATTGSRRLPTKPITPLDISRLRSRVFNIVSRHIATADRVLQGTAQWSNSQTRVFSILVNKVIPDLHHTLTEINTRPQDPKRLTREELEKIVADSEHDKTISRPIDQ